MANQNEGGRANRGWRDIAETGVSHSEAATEEAASALVLPCHSDRTGLMAEETIWRGTASQLKNLGCFVLCFLFCWLIVPIFIGFRRYLETKNQVFELTRDASRKSRDLLQGMFRPGGANPQALMMAGAQLRQENERAAGRILQAPQKERAYCPVPST